MFWFEKILNKILSPLTDIQSDFSIHPQTYQVEQSIEVLAYGDTLGELVLPVPASADFQEVYPQDKQELLFDPLYHNNYERLPFKLFTGKTFKAIRRYRIKRRPQMGTSEGFKLSGYKNNPLLDKKYLRSNRYVSLELPEIKKIAEEVLQKQKMLDLALKRVNEYVIKQLAYGRPKTGLYSVSEALSGQTVDCGGYDTLFVSICLALGIPARVVSGFWLGYEKNEMHAWVELQLPNGKWLPADPSVEALRKSGGTKKLGALGFIGADRVTMSYGCDIQLDRDNDFVTDILQVPFVLPRNEQVQVSVKNKLKSRILN